MEEAAEVIVLLTVTRIPAKSLGAPGEVARTNLAPRSEKFLQGLHPNSRREKVCLEKRNKPEIKELILCSSQYVALILLGSN